MGRKKKLPTKDGDVVAQGGTGSGVGKKMVSEAAVERLGLNNLICQDCNANNPQGADTCRKCGKSNLRRKKSEYSDE